MIHETLQEKLAEFFDGELRGPEREELFEHLKICGDCRQRVQRWEQMKRAFLNAREEKPSEFFISRVMERIRKLDQEPEKTPSPIPVFLRWLFPALGYAFAFIFMVAVIAHREAQVNAESILLSDVPSNAQWIVSSEPPDAGQLWNT